MLASQRHLTLMTNLGLANATIIGALVILLDGGMKTPVIAAYGAALGVGSVLGFLFGVPSPNKGQVTNVRADTAAISTGDGSRNVRGDVSMSKAANADDAEAKPEHTSAHVAPGIDLTTRRDRAAQVKHSPPQIDHQTSNLERVADWVTKLLLGGGLTQMSRIPPKVWQWSHAVAMGNPAPDLAGDRGGDCGGTELRCRGSRLRLYPRLLRRLPAHAPATEQGRLTVGHRPALLRLRVQDSMFRQAERRSFLVPILLAVAAIAAAILLDVHFFPAATVKITQVHTEVVPTLTVYKGSAVIGNGENNQVLFVASQIQVDNQLRVPISLDDFELTLTEPDNSELTVEGVQQTDLPELETNFPALKPLLTTPLRREAVIAPKQAATGTILFSLRLSKDLWDQRKSAVVKVNLYHQPTVSITIPK